MSDEKRNRFAKVANLPDDKIVLDEAALLIAADMQENVDIPHYLSVLDDLATKFEKSQEGAASLGVSINGLIDFIHVEEGFTGSHKDYYSPENSYLNRVLETRHGIPITLALIHISLGSRLGIPVSGISFPTHFLISYGTDTQIIVDPFAGRILSKPDCATLLRQTAAPGAPKPILREEYFTRAANKDILMRILDNLKRIFWDNKAWEEAKLCIDRQLLLLPGSADFDIQLGAVYEMQGNVPLAQHTYTQVLQASDDEKLRELVSKRLLALEPKGKTLH